MNILVTGGAGFIGNHLVLRLVSEGHTVISIDNCSISDQSLQKMRLERLVGVAENLTIDITDFESVEKVFSENTFDVVYHLAAKPGVRESITNPFIYAQSNYIGTLNIFECAKRHNVPHVVAASSSSVYGRNSKAPFSETDRVDEPISVYASTKRAGELLAYTYCDLFKMNITNLRFFTVYGPYGRPDMAPWIFTEKMLKKETIRIFDHGKHKRDFTYVDDIVDGCVGAGANPQGYNILNLGNGNPVELMGFIETIESLLGLETKKEFVDAQKGDVNLTYADISRAKDLFGYQPKISIQEGMKEFISWYKEAHDC